VTVLNLETVTLEKGCHQTLEDGVCAMEMVAYLAGETHSDSPACTSPVLAAFVRSWNDVINDDATRARLLKPILPRLIGTVGSRAVEQRRADLALDWSIRVSTPAWLRLAGLPAEADAIAALPPLLDRSAIIAAQPTLERALTRAAAAGDAAGDAAWAAAGDAAGDAARSAAGDAARAAAGDAAWDAARAAAGDAAWGAARDAAWGAARAAAWDAAGDALKTTVEQLQQSALDLLDRMIAVTDADLVTRA
jgi:hypothetical protein